MVHRNHTTGQKSPPMTFMKKTEEDDRLKINLVPFISMKNIAHLDDQ